MFKRLLNAIKSLFIKTVTDELVDTVVDTVTDEVKKNVKNQVKKGKSL